MVNNILDIEVNIYTDGACRGNPGPGGWGALLVYGNNKNYALHIRTKLTLAPWQFYSYNFLAKKKWLEKWITLEPSRMML